jgi:hypothetical protein
MLAWHFLPEAVLRLHAPSPVVHIAGSNASLAEAKVDAGAKVKGDAAAKTDAGAETNERETWVREISSPTRFLFSLPVATGTVHIKLAFDNGKMLNVMSRGNRPVQVPEYAGRIEASFRCAGRADARFEIANGAVRVLPTATAAVSELVRAPSKHLTPSTVTAAATAAPVAVRGEVAAVSMRMGSNAVGIPTLDMLIARQRHVANSLALLENRMAVLESDS